MSYKLYQFSDDNSYCITTKSIDCFKDEFKPKQIGDFEFDTIEEANNYIEDLEFAETIENQILGFESDQELFHGDNQMITCDMQGCDNTFEEWKSIYVDNLGYVCDDCFNSNLTVTCGLGSCRNTMRKSEAIIMNGMLICKSCNDHLNSLANREEN